MKKLILIDALALLYRSFYGIRDLSTKSGLPTNAIYGFVRKINEIISKYEPSHFAVVFDGGSPVFRKELLPEYKSQRKPMPDALREQIEPLKNYLNAADIFHILIDNQEADDVMASLAIKGQECFDAVYIASGDKDMFQLINDKIKMLSLSGTVEVTDAIGVKEKTGVVPEMIIDWLALVGDAADNIPGVPGVGAKTAARLLNEYESIRILYERYDDLSASKVKESLGECWDILERNIKLVSLDTAIECGCEWDELAVVTPDPDKLLPILDMFEFKTMAKDLREPTLF
jgi:DNA polymerase-1